MEATWYTALGLLFQHHDAIAAIAGLQRNGFQRWVVRAVELLLLAPHTTSPRTIVVAALTLASYSILETSPMTALQQHFGTVADPTPCMLAMLRAQCGPPSRGWSARKLTDAVDLVERGGRQFVRKHFDLDKQSGAVVECVRELHALRQLARHPNIVPLRESGLAGKRAELYFPRGTCLRNLLPLPEARARSCALHLARALSFLHDRNVAHRDVKPDNIILLGEDRFCLTDFGSSTHAADEWHSRWPICTITTAPMQETELDAWGRYRPKKLDIWSYGATLLFVATGTAPGPKKSADAETCRLHWEQQGFHTGKLPQVATDYFGTQVLLGCLQTEPMGRLSMQEIVSKLLAWQSVKK